MNRAKRMLKSKSARAKRRMIKDIIYDCIERKFNKLRKLRRAGKRNTKV